MKNLFILILLFPTLELKSQNLDSLALKEVAELPEVIERAEYLKQLYNGERTQSTKIIKKPDRFKEDFIWVRVGHQNKDMYLTHFDFFVYDSLTIEFYNPFLDQSIELEKWRKSDQRK